MTIPQSRIIQYETENPAELTTEQMAKLKYEITHRQKGIMSDELVDFMLWQYNLPSRQETFAQYVCKFIPRNSSILEVGCGRTAKLSRILKSQGYSISCMDPQVDSAYLEDIESLKERFNFKTTDIEKYDWLIAQEPCDATEHVVRACVANQKSLIMSLCGVPHKLINGKMPSSTQEWYSHLQDISPIVKIRYATLDPLTITPILKVYF